MKNNRAFVSSVYALAISLLMVVSFQSCKKSNSNPTNNPPAYKNSLLYVYKNDSTDGVAFRNLMQSNGCSVTLIDKTVVPTFNYSSYNMIVIGENSDSPGATGGNNWNPTNAAAIKGSGKPCLLLGAGGLLFADAIGNTVGWGNSAGAVGSTFMVMPTTSNLYKQPKAITVPADSVLTIFTTAETVEEFYQITPAAGIVLVGKDPAIPTRPYYPIATDSTRYTSFGFTGNTDSLNVTGRDFFVNLVYYAGKLKQ